MADRDSAEKRGGAGLQSTEKVAYVTIMLLAVVLCAYRLGARPFDHDEALHAVVSWKMATQGPDAYQQDLAHNGPVPYYVTAGVLRLLGDSNFTARAGAALFGLAVLAFAPLLRVRLGRWGALGFLVLLAFSPSWLYFSRFLQHEVFLAAFVLAAVHFTFRYGETLEAHNLYIAGLSLALAAATTTEVYLLVPWLALCGLGMMLWGVLRREQSLAAAMRESGALCRRAAVPFLTSAILFVIVLLAFHTGFFTQGGSWETIGDLFRTVQPNSGSGGTGSWWYYLVRLMLYEPLIFFPALLAVAMSFLRKPAPSRFERFVVLWAVGALVIYATALPKAPWRLVAQILPLALIAAGWFGALINSGALRKPAVLAPTTALGVLTLWSLVNVNFLRDAPAAGEPAKSRAELLVPEQSTYDLVDKVMGRIETVGRELGTGTGTRVTVSGEATWPLRWYLRHYPVTWTSVLSKVETPVLVVDRKATITTQIDAVAGDAYERIPFELRGGWNPAWSRAGVGNVLRFLLTREAWSDLDAKEGILYACKDLRATSACPVLRLKSPIFASTDSAERVPAAAAAVWGKLGNGPGEFNEPRDLATDRWGNIYVADAKNNRIQKLDAAGKVMAIWGAEGTGPGQFKEPCGVAVAPNGMVYVADTWNHRIQEFDRNGTFVRQWAEQDPPFWGPRGIAVAADGTVFVTDTGNKRVLAYTANGSRLRAWGGEGSEPGQFIEPVGIAVTGSGRVVVADTGNHRLQFFEPDGTFVEAWPVTGWEAFYTEPYVDTQDGDVYVTDSSNNRFVRYRRGKLDAVWDSSAVGSDSLNRPIGIATGGPGIVYVSDTLNHRIRRFLVD